LFSKKTKHNIFPLQCKVLVKFFHNKAAEVLPEGCGVCADPKKVLGGLRVISAKRTVHINVPFEFRHIVVSRVDSKINGHSDP